MESTSERPSHLEQKEAIVTAVVSHAEKSRFAHTEQSFAVVLLKFNRLHGHIAVRPV